MTCAQGSFNERAGNEGLKHERSVGYTRVSGESPSQSQSRSARNHLSISFIPPPLLDREGADTMVIARGVAILAHSS